MRKVLLFSTALSLLLPGVAASQDIRRRLLATDITAALGYSPMRGTNNLSEILDAAASRLKLGAAASGANADITSLTNPALGAATATTPAGNDSTTRVANTLWVNTRLNSYLPLAGGTLTNDLNVITPRTDANLDIRVNNTANSNATGARLALLTGAASANASSTLLQTGGTAPLTSIISGIGNSGGISVQSLAGPIALSPANGVITGPASSMQVLPANTLVSSNLADLFLLRGVQPDWFRQPSDGTDDAIAVQRAINFICNGSTSREIVFRNRHYKMQSPVAQTCQINWRGQGWQETAGDLGNMTPAVRATAMSTMTGTWLDFDAGAFNNNGQAPVTITGYPASGTSISNIGVTQPVVLPISGAADWAGPADTPPIFYAFNIGASIDFSDIFCLGVNRCINSISSGRSSFRRIKGQVWRSMVYVDKAYDAVRLDDIHATAAYTLDNRVIGWQQSNTGIIWTGRTDNLIVGRVSVFGTNIGLITFYSAAATASGVTSPEGTTTGGVVANISCDMVRYCVYTQAPGGDIQYPTGVSLKIGHLHSYSQDYNSTPAAPVMLTNSMPLFINGPRNVIQIDTLDNSGSDVATVDISATTGVPSQVRINSVFNNNMYLMGAGAVFALLGNGPGHRVLLSMPPAYVDAPKPGYAVVNGGTNGVVAWPQLVAQ